MKKKLCFTLLIVITLFAVVAMILGSVSSSKHPLTIKMFDSIQDFYQLEPYEVQSDDTEDDQNVKDLEVVEQYSKLVSYKGTTYKVRAYVFSNVTSAQVYFKRTTEKNVLKTQRWSYAGNVFFQTEYVVFYENCAYCVEGKTQNDCTDFINWFSADFPYELYT